MSDGAPNVNGNTPSYIERAQAYLGGLTNIQTAGITLGIVLAVIVVCAISALIAKFGRFPWQHRCVNCGKPTGNQEMVAKSNLDRGTKSTHTANEEEVKVYYHLNYCDTRSLKQVLLRADKERWTDKTGREKKWDPYFRERPPCPWC